METNPDAATGIRILPKIWQENQRWRLNGAEISFLYWMETMDVCDYSGYWVGKFEGTNQGGLTIDLKQNGSELTGVARLAEPAHGQYEYSISGVAGKNLSVDLKPERQSGAINLGLITVLASMDSHGQLAGRWRSTIGTEGIFSAKRFEISKLAESLPRNNSVFLVHGHDEGAKHAVARFLEQLGHACGSSRADEQRNDLDRKVRGLCFTRRIRYRPYDS